MKYLFSLSLILFSLFTARADPDTSSLQALLDLDRFEAYTEAWAATMRGRGKEQIAGIIQRMDPADFQKLKLDPAKLRDAHNYDELIFQVLRRSHPQVSVTQADVDWGYNFFKNKLNDAYLVEAVRAPPVRDPAPMPSSRRVPGPLPMEALDSSEVLLDVDGYASDRTTRAAFWEASLSRRQIELFPGSASSFQDELTRRGARIVGEVGTKARNYNPIYLIQNPGETGYHYAITEISGADRLRHFQLQASLVRWQLPNGTLASPPPVSVVGNAMAVLAEEERALTAVLQNIERADHIVIGQKGAFERTFGSLGKIQSLMALQQKDPQSLTRLYSANELKIVTRAAEAGKDLPEFVMKYASDIDKLYQKADPLLERHNLRMQPFTAFNYDRGSYVMSDYIVRGMDGKDQRWRIFSNVWGDEVLPIARALKASGYNSVNYIGTAGAFVGTDLKVGDLVVPRNAATLSGELTVIPRNTTVSPEGFKSVAAVVNVQSPFEETSAWLAQARKTSQVVEVETGYLASVFNSPTDNLNVQLLISDVVGSEHETLAAASSSSRRRAQIAAISSVIEDAGVVHTGLIPQSVDTIERWLQELLPNRDPASRVQLTREAHAQGIKTKAELETFIKTQKSFTTAKLEQVLRGADARLQRILTLFKEKGLNPAVNFSVKLFDGSYNPAMGPVEVRFVGSAQDEAAIHRVVEQISRGDKDFDKFFSYTFAENLDNTNFINVGRANDTLPTVKNVYQDGMVRYGGLAFVENSSGNLKLVRVSAPSAKAFERGAGGQITTSAACSITRFSGALDELLK